MVERIIHCKAGEHLIQEPIEARTVEARAKIVIMGAQGSGKTGLVNQIRTRGPIKQSGAEKVAGYCFYNERVIFHCDKKSSDDNEGDLIAYNTRLSITEVR